MNFSRIFSKAVHQCMEDPTEMATVIMHSQIELRRYIAYCQNKPFSEHIVHINANFLEKIREKLEQQMTVS